MAGLDAGNDHFELFHLPDLFLFVPALFQCVDNGLGLFPVKDLFRDVARVLQQFVGHAKVFGDVRVVFQLQRLARSGKGTKAPRSQASRMRCSAIMLMASIVTP